MTTAFPSYGRCIFCGDYKKLTEEHVWPVWLRQYIDFDLPVSGSASIDVHPDNSEEIVAHSERKGDLRNRGVTKVCRDCNSEWMSQLQERAKRELIAMAHGESFSLLPDGQRVIAAWVTMAVMTAEFYFDAIAIPAVERLSLKLTSSPLRTWKVWAGSYERGDWQSHLAHATGPLIFPGDPEPKDGEAPTRNTQTTSLVVGQAYFHAFSCPNIPFTEHMDLQCEGRLVQIWPPLGPLAWPTPVLSDLQADRLASAIFDRLNGRPFSGLPPAATRPQKSERET